MNETNCRIDKIENGFIELVGKVDENSRKIELNSKKIDRNSEKIDRNSEKIDRNSEQIDRNAKKIDQNTKAIRSLENEVHEFRLEFEAHTKKTDLIYDVVLDSNRILSQMRFLETKVDNHEVRISALESEVKC